MVAYFCHSNIEHIYLYLHYIYTLFSFSIIDKKYIQENKTV